MQTIFYPNCKSSGLEHLTPSLWACAKRDRHGGYALHERQGTLDGIDPQEQGSSDQRRTNYSLEPDLPDVPKIPSIDEFIDALTHRLRSSMIQ